MSAIRLHLGPALACLAGVVLALAGAGCNNPVTDDEVALLGPEVAGVPPGPLHRPGQPCLVCHGGYGPAALVFGTAGTVYQDSTDPFPLVSGTVQLTDANNVVTLAETNCAGNFFLEAVDWVPTMPVHVQVAYGGLHTQSTNACNSSANACVQMLSHMGKETSCAQCHTGQSTYDSVGQVYLNSSPPSCMTPADCPTDWACTGGNCVPPPSGCPTTN